MNFFFSTSIGRRAFLARYLFANAALLFGVWLFFRSTGFFGGVTGDEPTSLPALLLAMAASSLVILPALHYLLYFTVVARLRSIGSPAYFALWMAVPFLAPLIVLFQGSEFMTVAKLFLLLFGVAFLIFLFVLLATPEEGVRAGIAQSILQEVEVGQGRFLIGLVPLSVTVLVLAGLYDFGPFSTLNGQIGGIYHGLSDSQSMDYAQVARQIVRGQGFTTKFLRPYAVAQLHQYAITQSALTGQSGELFPADRYPAGTERILPDTYNAPGYPYLLAGWFYLVHPRFDIQPPEMIQGHINIYPGDRWIPILNQLFMFLTAGLIFALGFRLFDERVAWVSMIAFLFTDLVWRYTLTGLPTNFLMFLITGVLFCTMEIFSIGEACFENEEHSFLKAWAWALLLGLLLAVASLTRFQLLGLLVPLLLVLIFMPRANILVFILIALVVVGAVAPWFWHIDEISGSPLGSNKPMLLYGVDDSYKGNQIYCTTSIPTYERLFKDLSKKEYLGFRWHFDHAWELLGATPLILLFAVCILHRFKRIRAQVFFWLVVGCSLAIIAVNNFAEATPEAVDRANTLVVLFPCMLVIGSAYFFILLDRLNLSLFLLNNIIVGAMLVLTSLPLFITITTTSNELYSFPPYMPPVIKLVGQLSNPDEWVTTDMPWATAWYADRPSLWLPDSLANFENLNDTVCPSGVLLLTPVTWAQPADNLINGEMKDWFPLVMTANLPPAQADIPTGFPLHEHVAIAVPEYSLWSDRPRWQSK